MPPRELKLYNTPDGTCALKIDGDDEVRLFTDLLEAFDFIHTLPDTESYAFTIYDALGNATLHGPI